MLDIFIDSAVQEDVLPLLETGLFSGVTTNPTLLRQAGVTLDTLPDLVETLRSAGARTVFAQTWGSTPDELAEHAALLRERCGEVGIKVPVGVAGLALVRRLKAEQVPTLLTGVYKREQILPAIQSGADWVAPYVGRMSDNGRDGVTQTIGMQRVLDAAGSSTRLLVASIRSAADVADMAEAGVDGFTISPARWRELVADELTDAAMDVFEAHMRDVVAQHI
ncbi:transaldolase [Georgenia soli]|uniref:Transaldolase n=1 Tax=Georgenia soli TaxID=638953 RepID=A0A2A9EPL6_9MICO|nr:transaldolase family protein [Georgenia soli]PFG41047.1 transaldolase [Georgenia soli]